MLVVYRGAELFQLLCKIFSAGFVCRSIGYAGAEVYLLLDIPVSAVCIELGYADCALGLFSLTVGYCPLLLLLHATIAMSNSSDSGIIV